VFNDMCFFAPGSLLDPSIRWRELEARTVEATYTNGPHTVRAELVFDDSGALVDFRSDDRPALAEDGKTLLSQRWSTPVREYRAMGPYGSSRAARPATPRQAATARHRDRCARGGSAVVPRHRFRVSTGTQGSRSTDT
jgi:hypothetical protein